MLRNLRTVIIGSVLIAALFSVVSMLTAIAGPYGHLPQPGNAVRFRASGGAPAAWAYADQGWLETFLRLSIDAAINRSSGEDDRSAVSHARQRALAVDNGTQGLVGEVHSFHYRDHDDVEVQVLIKEGSLRNHVYWTTAAELVDAGGHKFLK